MDGKRIRCKVVDWIHMTQDRDKWQGVLGAVIGQRQVAGCFGCSNRTGTSGRVLWVQ
jgi:hypothetical protein